MCVNVSIVPCADYSTEEAANALKAVLEPLGGLDWVEPGMKIAVKANLVARMKPESAATDGAIMSSEPNWSCSIIAVLSPSEEFGKTWILSSPPDLSETSFAK